MSVTLQIPTQNTEHLLSATPRRAARRGSRAGKTLSIGLVNNMPDGALEATERQFVSLLEAASEGCEVQLTLYHLPGVPRGESATARIKQRCLSTEALSHTRPDALIVTGREPLSPRLQDEPYWGSFVRVLEWARINTSSTVWSCLAAHAAVLHMHGVQRRRSAQKYCGIFACDRLLSHPLNSGGPARFRMPHSRWNGLPEEDLTRNGYQILSRAGDAGADCFVKDEGSLFVFFQGHPEYEPETLLLEYRRDVGRYLRGESDAFPGLPRGYFDAATESEIEDIERNAAARTHEETLQRVAALRPDPESEWRPEAVRLYRNWLAYLWQQKTRGRETAVDGHHRLSPAQPLFEVQAGFEEPCREWACTD